MLLDTSQKNYTLLSISERLQGLPDSWGNSQIDRSKLVDSFDHARRPVRVINGQEHIDLSCMTDLCKVPGHIHSWMTDGSNNLKTLQSLLESCSESAFDFCFSIVCQHTVLSFPLSVSEEETLQSYTEIIVPEIQRVVREGIQYFAAVEAGTTASRESIEQALENKSISLNDWRKYDIEIKRQQLFVCRAKELFEVQDLADAVVPDQIECLEKTATELDLLIACLKSSPIKGDGHFL